MFNRCLKLGMSKIELPTLPTTPNPTDLYHLHFCLSQGVAPSPLSYSIQKPWSHSCVLLFFSYFTSDYSILFGLPWTFFHYCYCLSPSHLNTVISCLDHFSSLLACLPISSLTPWHLQHSTQSDPLETENWIMSFFCSKSYNIPNFTQNESQCPEGAYLVLLPLYSHPLPTLPGACTAQATCLLPGSWRRNMLCL